MNENDFQNMRAQWAQQSTSINDVAIEGVVKMSNRLRSQIRARNFIEWCAAAFVAIFFSYSAAHASTWWSIAMNIEIALAAIFIAFYLWFHGRYTDKSTLEISSVEFITQQQGQLGKQIRLLSTIKYWYILPILFGVVGLIGEQIVVKWSSGAPPWIDLARLLGVIAFGFVLAYLNEVKAVNSLKAKLASLPHL